MDSHLVQRKQLELQYFSETRQKTWTPDILPLFVSTLPPPHPNQWKHEKKKICVCMCKNRVCLCWCLCVTVCVCVQLLKAILALCHYATPHDCTVSRWRYSKKVWKDTSSVWMISPPPPPVIWLWVDDGFTLDRRKRACVHQCRASISAMPCFISNTDLPLMK